jgi:hypothetical protein
MSKKEKQEVVKRVFKMDNISNANSNKAFKPEEKISKDVLVPIKFKVHKDILKSFHILRIDYSKSNEKFGLSNNEMFAIAVHFMVDDFKERDLLQLCPDDFKEAIIKPGKRKATHRTFPSKETDSILFTINESVADLYMDLMFSFIINDPDDSIYNSHHSRTYFFYDFMEFMKTRKKDLMKYEMK